MKLAKEKKCTFLTFILPLRKFLQPFCLSQFIEYWNIYNFTYQKTISYAFLLVFKIVKNLQYILKYNPTYCNFNETDMVLFYVFNDIF